MKIHGVYLNGILLEIFKVFILFENHNENCSNLQNFHEFLRVVYFYGDL